MKREIVVKLLTPVFDGGKRLEALSFAGGRDSLPVSGDSDRPEIDVVAVMQTVAAKSGVSLAAVAKLSAPDFALVLFALFGPPDFPSPSRTPQPRKK